MIALERLNLIYYTYDKDRKMFIPRMERSSIFKVQEIVEIMEELKQYQIEVKVNLDETISIVEKEE